METSALITFIGTGRPHGKEEYQKTKYIFENGIECESPLVISCLFNYLRERTNLRKVIVIGTEESIWSELSKINSDVLEGSELYEKIWEETWEKMYLKNY